MQTGPTRGNATEPALDGRNRPGGTVGNQRCYYDGDDACRHPFRQVGPRVKDHESEHADGKGVPVDILQMSRERGDLLRHMPGHFEAEPEEFIQLPAEYDDGDAASEPRDDRVGEKL